jgi:hypothetical protein
MMEWLDHPIAMVTFVAVFFVVILISLVIDPGADE